MHFEMARALVKRARERADWIGDDHGTPYEAALLSRSVTIEMHVAFKEILDHLRSALDYCAHELCEVATRSQILGQVYFPITARGFAAGDFRSRVGKLMPGLLQNRPDLVTVLERFQAFSSADNGWLSDLATLANRTKHVEFAIQEVSSADAVFGRDEATGHSTIQARKQDGTPVSLPSLALIEVPNGLDGAGARFVYLWLNPIDQDLIGFVRAATVGVATIIDALESELWFWLLLHVKNRYYGVTQGSQVEFVSEFALGHK